MAQLTLDQIKEERDRLVVAIQTLETQKIDALDNSIITVEQFRRINGEQLRCENVLNDLNVQIAMKAFSSITVGDSSPAAKIRQSIFNLNSAIQTLNNIRSFLDAVADVISGINVIVGVIAGL